MAEPILFDRDLDTLDPQASRFLFLERKRQIERIVLIASESIAPRPVRETLTSELTNIYAEGYPSTRMSVWEADRLDDVPRHLAFFRRYADRRYYKGTEFCNFVETLAQRRGAEMYAAHNSHGLRAEDVFVNVQPLSGAAAVNACYGVAVQPGDKVMGFDLPSGGHLTHGSPFNRSGKTHTIIPYYVDTKTGRLDYDWIIDTARREKPKLIIAGASAYPWAIDFEAFRRAADAAGALLLADVSHPAGLIVTGNFPNPLGYADMIVNTTHKTLCGPRGAMIVSTDPKLAKKIDLAVFPGEQGGPHLNSIAAKAVAFAIARTPEFHELQRRVKVNAKVFADECARLGLSIGYGGTESHLFLIDLKQTAGAKGKLNGDIASRMLDICGITLNKNTIAGDKSANNPSGLRIGTTWISQLGFDEASTRELAGAIARLLKSTQPFDVLAARGYLGRGKAPLDVLLEVRQTVRTLLDRHPWPEVAARVAREEQQQREAERDVAAEVAADPQGKALQDAVARGEAVLHVRGERALHFLQSLTTGDLRGLRPGQRSEAYFLDGDGTLIAAAAVVRLTDAEFDQRRYLVHAPAAARERLTAWLQGHNDGYILFGQADLYTKIDGPVALEDVHDMGAVGLRELAQALTAAGAAPLAAAAAGTQPEPGVPASDVAAQHPERFHVDAPYFVGQPHVHVGEPPAKPAFEWREQPAEDEASLKRSCLYDQHVQHKARLVPFAGWKMPVLYSGIAEEHAIVRRAAGLFDVSHMGCFEVSGEGAQRFLDQVTTNFVTKLRPGNAHYSYLPREDGTLLDDIIVYCRGHEHYLVVVNAANEDKDWAWLHAVNEGTVRVDAERPWVRVEGGVTIRNLKTDRSLGDAMLVDLALQGPTSRKILQSMTDDAGVKAALDQLGKFDLIECTLAGMLVIVARTGYTGEPVGFEVFVHPDRAPAFWDEVLKRHDDYGVTPIGLGARDSLRTEAGFPLYGHELDGPYGITATEAGYGSFIKRHKPFFVGRGPILAAEATRKMEIVRFRVGRSGVRTLHLGAPVVNGRGQVVGYVTSSALVGTRQIGLAWVERRAADVGSQLGVFIPPRKAADGAFKDVAGLSVGDTVPLSEPIEVLRRYGTKREFKANVAE